MREFANWSLPDRTRRFSAELGLALGAGLVLAFLGPFGTFDTALLARVGYWVGLCALWFVIMAAIGVIADAMPPFRMMPVFHRLLIKIAVGAVPMLAAVLPATYALEALEGAVFKDNGIAVLYPKILLLGAVLSFVSLALFGDEPASVTSRREVSSVSQRPLNVPEDAVTPDDPHAPDNRPADFPRSTLARMSRLADGPILCLEMEDHYVRVHGGRRSGLALMRMTDAVAAMDTIPGLRVHRSWWVARDAVQEVRRSGRTLRLTLANGLSVPVSQSYLKAAAELFSSAD